MTKVFIDGSAGTTGLRIHDRLKAREDIELIILDDSVRKDENAIKEAIFSSDITFLCLPDEAARQAVALAQGSKARIIDTSTAHRVSDGWTYGFPEIGGLREKIASSARVANPGCHASGFVSLVAPLTENGIIPSSALLTCFSLTGYSGGGKKMIADYTDPAQKEKLASPAMYGTSQSHKHLPEMKKMCSLDSEPVFCPVVAPYYSGMEVTVPLFAGQINGTKADIEEIYKSYYGSGAVRFSDENDTFVYAGALSGRDDMIIKVTGNDERILLVSLFDNLGKGASGAAIQNMNIMLGLDEMTGLNV